MIVFSRFIIFIFILNIHSVYAKDSKNINSLNKCIPTKNILDDYEPLEFNLTNNLITSSKVSEDSLQVPKILIFGKLVDQNCMPVANAKIYAWQVGINGKYPYKPLRTSSVSKSLFKEDSLFLGNATTITDNNGSFVLVATYPKKSKNPTTHGVNVRAEHKGLKTVQTRFEFLPLYKEVRSIQHSSFYKSDIEDLKAYNLKIVMPGKVRFLEY
jgi:protocatechuate 3,4-dioxygenase beta subunit